MTIRCLVVVAIATLVLSSCAAYSDAHDRAIFLLVGQSNMSGRGELENATVEATSGVWIFGNDHQWRNARHPIDASDGQLDRVSNDGDKPGVGLGISFANRIVRETNAEVGLVPCAKGGTSIVEWLPQQEGNDAESLFENCIDRAEEAASHGRVVGVLFHQGETDARTLVTARHWDALFAVVADELRNRLHNPELPIVYAQIGTVSDEQRKTYVHWEAVQESQERVRLRCADMVLTSDLPLKPDGLHLSSPALERLGERYAQAFLAASGDLGGGDMLRALRLQLRWTKRVGGSRALLARCKHCQSRTVIEP